MAINKKLISFATQIQFDNQLSAGNIDNRSIIFIEDKKRIWTHGVYFDTSWEFVTGKPATFTPSSHTIGSHSDVTLTTPANGNILKYDGTKWVNNTLAQAGIATPSDITNAVDNIEIGGRNLLLNSGVPVTNSNYPTKVYDLSPIGQTLVDGEDVTVVIKGSLGAGKSYFKLYNSGGSVSSAGATIYPSEFIDGIAIKTFKWSKLTASNTTLYVYPILSTVTVDSTIEWIKLVRGNKTSRDWTPAPEDQVSDWNTADINSFSFIKNKPTTLSGYGITDAYTKTQIDTSINTKVSKSGDTMTGALEINLGASGNYPLNLTSAGVTTNIGSLNSTWCHFNTTAATGFYFYKNIQTPLDVTARSFIGALSGNASSATKLQAARTIAGVSFDGTANIDIPFSGLTSIPNTFTPSPHDHENIVNWSNVQTTSHTYSQLPNGVSVAFTSNAGGYGSYGSVLNVKAYPSSGGGTLQLYIPYSNTYGGTGLKYRKFNYAGDWGSLNTIWDSGNLTNLNQLTTRNFSDLQNKPTTLSGYGISSSDTLFDSKYSASGHTHNYLPLDTGRPVVDLDTLRTSGIRGGSSTTTNRPSGSYGYSPYMVMQSSSDRFVQLWFDSYGGNNIYYRNGTNSVWGEWNRLALVTDNVASATKVNNQLTLKFDTGTTEDTNLYTYDGSAAKTINIKAGSNVSFTKTANTITINSTNTNTTYPAGTKELLQPGTDTTNRVWSGKTLKDWYLEEIDILLDSDRFTGSTFSSNVIDLTNVNGAFNVNSANNYTTYTLSNNKVRGAWARVLVNSSIPITITGVKLINLGSNFELNTNMYLNVIYDGINTLGYYTKVAGSITPSYYTRTDSIVRLLNNTPIGNFSTYNSSIIIDMVDTPKNVIKYIYFYDDYSGTTSMGSYFLSNCTSLTSIDLSSMTNVTSIGSYFLSNCTSLTSIDLSSMTNVTSISGGFLSSCTSLTSIDLSSMTNVTSIDNFLAGCTSLTSVDLSPMTNVTNIGISFLNGCTSLTSVNLSSMTNVTSIGSYFLSNCTSLTSIDLSSMTNVTNIGHSFLISSGVNTLKMGAIVPPSLINELPNTLTSILVPSAAVNAYKAATHWSDKASIISGY